MTTKVRLLNPSSLRTRTKASDSAFKAHASSPTSRARVASLSALLALLSLTGCLGKGLDMGEYNSWYHGPRSRATMPTIGGLKYYWGAESYLETYSSYTALASWESWAPFTGSAGIFSWGGGPYPAFEPGDPDENEDWRYWNLPSVEFTGARTGNTSPPTALAGMYGFHLYLVAHRYDESDLNAPAPSSPIFSMRGAGATNDWTLTSGNPSGSAGVVTIGVFDNAGTQDFRINSNPLGGGGTIVSQAAGIPADLPSNEIFLHEVYFEPATCNLYYKVDPLNTYELPLEPAPLTFGGCPNTASNNFTDGIKIGSVGTGTTGIHELLIYDHALTQSERMELTDYFHDKYDPWYSYYY